MTHLYPLLIYVGLLESFALLALELIPRLRPWRKVATAFSLTLLTLLWLALPMAGRWLLSGWSPSTILGGVILLEITPTLWALGFALGAALSSAAWCELVDPRPLLPMSGSLTLLALLAVWFALLGASLLTVLAAWATFDLLWAAVSLLSGADGERVTFGLAVQGLSSLILWSVFLLLERAGISVFWRLMWPTTPVLTLILVAATMRIGLYPFHVALTQPADVLHTVSLTALLGPTLGMGLLYQLLSLPTEATFPAWWLPWCILALVWLGLQAWLAHGRRAVVWAGYATLALTALGGTYLQNPNLLLAGVGVWFASSALLLLARNRSAAAPVWAWPAWFALLFLLGVPPSPVGTLYRTLLAELTWVWRIPLILGWLLSCATWLRETTPPAYADVRPPFPWQRAALFTGWLLPLLALLALIPGAPALSFSWLGLGLWIVTLAAAAGLRFKAQLTRRWLRKLQPFWDALDGTWLYRAIWRGMEHILGGIGMIAEIIEGSGALLWSLLVLLIIFVVVLNR